jgi:hypothetical protein
LYGSSPTSMKVTRQSPHFSESYSLFSPPQTKKFRKLHWGGNALPPISTTSTPFMVQPMLQTLTHGCSQISIKATRRSPHFPQSYSLSSPLQTKKFRKLHCGGNTSAHISPTTRPFLVKRMLQAPTDGSYPTSIKVTEPYPHFSQSYSLSSLPQTKKFRKLHWVGSTSPHISTTTSVTMVKRSMQAPINTLSPASISTSQSYDHPLPENSLSFYPFSAGKKDLN